MRVVEAHLKSIAPYGQSRPMQSQKMERESHDDFELRCWRERIHCDHTGQAYMPPSAFKLMIAEAAKFTPRQGPTGGSSTWTKNFESGFQVLDPVPLHIHRDDVPGTRLLVPSDGKPGGTKRVWKHFPTFMTWEGIVRYMVYDDSITEDIFALYLREGGIFIGLGFSRPRRRGWWGRFEVKDIQWSEMT